VSIDNLIEVYIDRDKCVYMYLYRDEYKCMKVRICLSVVLIK